MNIAKLVASVLALWALPAFSQGCAMCYESAKHAGGDSQKALTRAVLVLLLPTLTLIGGMVALVYKYRNTHHD